MLELNHVSKIYLEKGGSETRALTNVSVKFGDTGMVFILGKSGCGKSTFLNIAGGLDTPTFGEIIINGMSSLEFSQADFDSYRNTVVGFVFQEYNVFPEFTVAENVALALELQGKKHVREDVLKILKEVDLDQYADRKPNMLSGGEKQRVAIARALVKDPRIIIADEPTGALDSDTGRQVLEMLQKLSRTRLVLVVSHDRDFAETYADRIIGLKDGYLDYDVTRVPDEAPHIGGSGNIRQTGPNTISIKSGATLTEDNIRDIQNFVSSRKGKATITTDEWENDGTAAGTAGAAGNVKGQASGYVIGTFRETRETDIAAGVEVHSYASGAAGVAAPGADAVSADNGSIPGAVLEDLPGHDSGHDSEPASEPVSGHEPEHASEYTAGHASGRARVRRTQDGQTGAGAEKGKQTRFIRSRLPIWKAIKMGASSLRVKPVRLVFTIILSVIALTLFGFMTCFMTFNMTDATISTLADSEGDQYLDISKSVEYTYAETDYRDGDVTEGTAYAQTYFSEADADALGYKDTVFGCEYSYSVSNAEFEGLSLYYRLGVNKAVYAPEGTSLRTSLLYGTYPEEDNEICISTYLAESLMLSRYEDADDIESYDDFSSAGTYTVSFDENSTAEALIGHHLVLSGGDVLTITGIFDAGAIPPRFDSLKTSGYLYSDLYYYLGYYLEDSMDQNILVTRPFIENLPKSYTMPADDTFYRSVYSYYVGETPAGSDEMSDDWYTGMNLFAVYGDDSLDSVFADGQTHSSLSGNDTIIPLKWIRDIAEANFKSSYDQDNMTEQEASAYNAAYEAFIYGSYYDENDVTYNIYRAVDGILQGSYTYSVYVSAPYVNEDGEIKDNGYWSYQTHTVNDAEREEMEKYVCEYLQDNPITLSLCQNELSSDMVAVTLNVAGYYTGNGYDDRGINTAAYGLYISAEMAGQIPVSTYLTVNCSYELPDDAVFSYMILMNNRSSLWLGSLLNKLDKVDQATGVYYSMANRTIRFVSTSGETMRQLSQIFLIVGIVVAVFAALLLFNFISASISSKNKEIGILRALGARRSDVFKIFFSESAIIAVICCVLAIIFTTIIVFWTNVLIKSYNGISVMLVVFTPYCMLMILAVAIIVAVLGTFIPVYSEARKKPADSIRSL